MSHCSSMLLKMHWVQCTASLGNLTAALEPPMKRRLAAFHPIPAHPDGLLQLPLQAALSLRPFRRPPFGEVVVLCRRHQPQATWKA